MNKSKIEDVTPAAWALLVGTHCVRPVSYLLGRRSGARLEARFLESLAELDVRAPRPDEWARIGELVVEYADFPLGGTDASVVSLAEQLGTELVITLDRRHFGSIRPRHCSRLRLLPEG